MPELSRAELSDLIAEATIDAYGRDEQLMGFAVMMENDLKTPFKTTVLGVKVTVESVIQKDSRIVANCVRGSHRQAISIEDLPLPEPPPQGAKWIAAYAEWVKFA